MGSCSSKNVRVDAHSLQKELPVNGNVQNNGKDNPVFETESEELESICVKLLLDRLYHMSETNRQSTQLDENIEEQAEMIDIMDDIYNRANDLIDPFRNALKIMFETDAYDKASEDGFFPLETMDLIDKAYSLFAVEENDKSVEWSGLYRRTLSKLFLETKTLDIICLVFIYYVLHGCDQDTENRVKFIVMTKVSTILWNLSDTAEELVDYIVVYEGFLKTIREALLNGNVTKPNSPAVFSKRNIFKRIIELDGIIQNEITQKFSTPAFHFLLKFGDVLALSMLCQDEIRRVSLSIPHNILTVRERNIWRFREIDFMSVVEPYLRSDDEETKLLSLSVLASIINEAESKIINANQDSVVYLLKCLKEGVETEERRYEGWSCKECVFIIRKLSRNDNNKKMLGELGTVALVVDTAKSGTEKETFECVLALWALAFDQDLKKEMVHKEDLGVVDMLQDVKEKYPSRKFQKACNGILWTIRDELKVSDNPKFKQIGLSMEVVEKTHDGTGASGHIMISYQKNSRKILKKIRDEIKRKGFKVWMDIDDMEGSTIESMAQAVEDASIVLMAMSTSYKNSENCRLEAKYAHTKQKMIVPLLMERDYKPDGWLGILLGDGLFYDFSGKYEFHDKIKELLKRIHNLQTKCNNGEQTMTALPEKSIAPVDSTDGFVTGRGESGNGMSKIKNSQHIILDWTESDRQGWILTYELTTPRLSQLTPDEIGLLAMMRHEAPEAFYKCVREMLEVDDFRVMARLVKALSSVA